jgi:oligopeptide transport system ATP-binding protein
MVASVEAPLLMMRGVAKHYPLQRGLSLRSSGAVKAVDGVDCSLGRGESLGVVGESGCGKTTLARLACALVVPTRGQVLFDGTDLGRLPGGQLRHLRQRFQIVFQNPYLSLNPRKTVRQHLLEPLQIHGRGTKSTRVARLERVLRDVGLPADVVSRKPGELSGGQRQRVAIARAIVLEPDLLVCDEVVSALDVSVKAEILNLLADLKHRYQLSMLFISHDLGVVRYICDRVAVMYLGRIVEIGTARQILTTPRHPYTEQLLASVPQPDPDRSADWLTASMQGEPPSPVNPPSGCHFRTRCPLAQDLCATTTPPLISVSTEHAVACHFRI